MAEIPSSTTGGIVVQMPFFLDVSGIEAELFGEEYELTGTDVPVTNTLSVDNFYTEGDGKAWLHYIQGENEDDFDVYVNREKSLLLQADISGALNLPDGAEYDAEVVGDNLDASLVFPAATGWHDYHSLQDFVISWYANKILGHPAALAAISNDSHIRTQVAEKFAEAITAINGQDEYAFTDLSGLDVNVDGVTTLTEMANRVAPVDGSGNGMGLADLQLIVQQVMNLAPGRFNSSVDRGHLAPLKWYTNDQIVIQLNMQSASYRVAVEGANSTRAADIRTGAGGAYVNSAAAAGQTYPIDDQSFKLIFTLA